jgi:ribosomal protein S18 acetylase RimI-like enzyme
VSTKEGSTVKNTEHPKQQSTIHHTYVFESDGKKISRNGTNNISVEQVTTFDEFTTFYRAPFRIYQDDRYWVAPFWQELKNFFHTKNPFWSHAECVLYIARKNNEVAGRIAAIIDHSFCETVGSKIGYFGFFECIDDFDTASALWSTAEDWLRSQGMVIMRGPIDGRIDVGCGFLYEGVHLRPTVLSSYTPPYYIALAEKYGMTKARDFFHYYIDLTKPITDRLKEKAAQCANSGVTIRPFRRLRTNQELTWWIPLFLETFSDHWGYVPVSKEEVMTRFGVKQLRFIVDPRLFVIAEFEDEPIAYLWATPDFNQLFQTMKGCLGPLQYLQVLLKMHKITVGKLHFIGIKKECRHRHVASYLNYKVLVEMQRRGYEGVEVGWIDEMNTHAHQTIAITGATLYKKHRVFEKPLEPSNLSTLGQKVRQ